jgi:hypothetical protein
MAQAMAARGEKNGRNGAGKEGIAEGAEMCPFGWKDYFAS